jgi:hypothetical protein
MSLFFGREREISIIKKALANEDSNLMIIRGRKGIGKSRLIQEVAQSNKSFRIQGIPNFFLISKKLKEGCSLIVFDEIPKTVSFINQFTLFWESQTALHKKIKIVFISSDSNFLEKTLLKHEFFIRLKPIHLKLQELPIHEAALFFNKNKKKTIFKTLLMTGGIPSRFKELNLENEFETVLGDLPSTRNDAYRKILKRLALGKASFEEICKTLEIKKGGTISGYLEDLKEIGVLAFDRSWDLRRGDFSRFCHYRLKDNAILNHLNPNSLEASFKNLIIQSRESLWSLLNLKKEDIVFAGPYFQRKTLISEESQIDYLIETKQKEVYLCEVRSVLGDLEEVKKRFKQVKVPKNFTIVPVLVTLKKESTSYFFEAVLTFDDFMCFESSSTTCSE